MKFFYVLTIIYLASIIHEMVWTGLTNDNNDNCENAACTGELVWDDGTSFDHAGASYAYMNGYVCVFLF